MSYWCMSLHSPANYRLNYLWLRFSAFLSLTTSRLQLAPAASVSDHLWISELTSLIASYLVHENSSEPMNLKVPCEWNSICENARWHWQGSRQLRRGCSVCITTLTRSPLTFRKIPMRLLIILISMLQWYIWFFFKEVYREDKIKEWDPVDPSELEHFLQIILIPGNITLMQCDNSYSQT